MKWWIGDLLVFGEARYGERYAQVLSMPQMNEHKVRDYIYVASRVARSRRAENLSFSHHRVVAPLEPLDQAKLLGDADREGWTREQLVEAKRNLLALRDAQEEARRRPADPLVDGDVIDAARGIGVVRAYVVSTASGSKTARAEDLEAEAAKALAALNELGRTVKQAAKRDRLHEAVTRARDVGQWQTGLPDPAVIIPGAAWQAVEAAHEENGGRP